MMKKLILMMVFCCSAAVAGEGRFIDTHVHFEDCREGALDRVGEWMKSNSVRRIINFPLSNFRFHNDEERKQTLANYAKHKDCIARACVIFPAEVKSLEETVRQLEREKQDGAVAFGEHYGGFETPENLRLIEACGKVGLPVMVHLGRKSVPTLEAALQRYPDCIIIAHSSAWWSFLKDGTCDRLLKTYPNLYADLSCACKGSLLVRDRKFANEFLIPNADKLLFGTDSGTGSIGQPPAREFALIDGLNLSKEVEEKICRGNAEKLFRGGKTAGSKPAGEQLK